MFASSSAGTKKKKIKIGTLSFQHEEAAEHDLEVFHFEFKSLK